MEEICIRSSLGALRLSADLESKVQSEKRCETRASAPASNQQHYHQLTNWSCQLFFGKTKKPTGAPYCGQIFVFFWHCWESRVDDSASKWEQLVGPPRRWQLQRWRLAASECLVPARPKVKTYTCANFPFSDFLFWLLDPFCFLFIFIRCQMVACLHILPLFRWWPLPPSYPNCPKAIN